MTTSTGGISGKNRQLLSRLNRQFPGPFSATDAAAVLTLDIGTARQLLARFAGRGWLARIRSGLYATVPLEASVPGEWRADAWLVATKLFSPGYIGGWSAAEHWDLTEQIFRDVLVFTSRRVRHRTQEIQGTVFRVKVISARKLFGAREVWRSRVPVPVSDASRTLIDVLDDPSTGGGMRLVSEMTAAYFEADARDDRVLIEYARRLGNGAVFKRLGHLIEVLDVEAPEIVGVCFREKTSGISDLDPTIPGGVIRKRWNLRVNVDL